MSLKPQAQRRDRSFWMEDVKDHLETKAKAGGLSGTVRTPMTTRMFKPCHALNFFARLRFAHQSSYYFLRPQFPDTRSSLAVDRTLRSYRPHEDQLHFHMPSVMRLWVMMSSLSDGRRRVSATKSREAARVYTYHMNRD